MSRSSPRLVRAVKTASDAGFLDLGTRPTWHRDALCLEHPEVDFFVDTTGDMGPAKRLCASCSVREECLKYALARPSLDGVWGGTSKRGRARIRRRAG
jgi:WhiB family transcriptional regulator, redox-sensing transcriptional regulator